MNGTVDFESRLRRFERRGVRGGIADRKNVEIKILSSEGKIEKRRYGDVSYVKFCEILKIKF